MLHVLEVKDCVSDSNRDRFTEDIKALQSANPFLKVIVSKNQCFRSS